MSRNLLRTAVATLALVAAVLGGASVSAAAAAQDPIWGSVSVTADSPDGDPIWG